jgi:methionyl-tRNA synthetase
MMYRSFSPIYSPYHFMGVFLPLIAVALIWTIILKGFALWYAARANQKKWFILLLIINTLGILEIIYLIWFRPEHHSSKEG